MSKPEAHLHERSPSFVISPSFRRFHHPSKRVRIQFICDVSDFDSLKLAELLHLVESCVAALIAEFIAVALEELAAFRTVIEAIV
jgi:hypothetical protein